MSKQTQDRDNGEKSGNFIFFSELLSGNSILKMQERSLVFSLRKCMSRKTMYSHGIEVSAASEMIASQAFINREVSNKDEIYRLYAMLSYAGIVRLIGQPPFGFSGNMAIRNWFGENLESLYLYGKKVCDILEPEMKEDLLNFSGTKRTLRYLVRYSHSDLKNAGNIISGLVDAESYKSGKSALYSERDYITLINKKNKFKSLLSYILEAAAYIVSATSILDDAVRNSCIISHQVMRYLRSNDNFSEDITDEEYQRYCNLVNLLDSCGGKNISSEDYRIRESETVHRWTILLRNEMCRASAECLYDNYENILSGTFTKDLISGSWCRILKPMFSKLLSVIGDSSGYVDSCLESEKVILGLTDRLVRTAIKYESGERISSIEEKILYIIPDIYKKVYREDSCDKSESEKIYLRIMMVLDYICDMTDAEAEKTYGRIC